VVCWGKCARKKGGAAVEKDATLAMVGERGLTARRGRTNCTSKDPSRVHGLVVEPLNRYTGRTGGDRKKVVPRKGLG